MNLFQFFNPAISNVLAFSRNNCSIHDGVMAIVMLNVQ